MKAQVLVERPGFRLDVGIEIGEEIVAMVGPNGAGKSTLLRVLAGLVRSDSAVEFQGTVWENPGRFVPPEERDLAMVFSRDLLLPHLTVAANVSLTARDDLNRWLETFDLAALAGSRPVELSAGERQRVALARSFARRPRLMLMDEPLSAVDVGRRSEIQQLILDSLREAGIPAIIVSHDPAAAVTLGDRIAVLEEGLLVQFDRPDQLKEHPQSRFVADLVGLNVYTGIGDGHRLLLKGTEITSAEPINGPARATIHPRAVSLHRAAPEGSSRNAWEGTITSIDRTFELIRVVVDGPLRITATVTENGLAAVDGRVGARVWASVKASEVTFSAH